MTKLLSINAFFVVHGKMFIQTDLLCLSHCYH